ncbi:MAG: amidophosphoribosyltransferase [Bacteroidetes bacterium]|nr:MAG: amidophosphoribosyltransferase [Bacteroidota bacterium]
MSDQIKHECGIALIRLLKPLEYYKKKYGTWMYGLNKLYLLMEKQHNRGQDGAGVVNVKIDSEPGTKYIHRSRSMDEMPIKVVFDKIRGTIQHIEEQNPEEIRDPVWAKKHVPYAGELYLGHLRYGTFGKNSIDNVHPVSRQNNWKSRNLVLAGNFNLTNVDELFNVLISLGQHPKDYSDTVTILENVGHFLDEENQALFNLFKSRGFSNKDISSKIEKNIDIQSVLKESSKYWDGGYAIAGLIGHGDSFVMRDPSGIRPAFYYNDDEIVVVASERAVIQTVMNSPYDKVKEVKPGYALIVKKDGDISELLIREPLERKSCSFERIYFSRGSDLDIYRERKKLGELIVPEIIKSIEGDLDNTVFSFIPNTAETAFYGMMQEIENYLAKSKLAEILKNKDNLSEKKLKQILNHKPRVEKIAIKDVKLRTFISQDEGRDDMVEHVYDITYGTIKKGVDNLVIIDDSIVRGTTLEKSILRILDRLEPKKIVVVSSSPQIRYPDCYGIDMAKLSDFIAFRAAIELLKETGKADIIDQVYKKSKAQQKLPKEEIVNYVKEIYEPFSPEEISGMISRMLTSKDINAEVEIVYQGIANLHIACPNDKGDWYFTGNYPTPGGNKVVNNSFINFVEGNKGRAY